MTIIKKAENQQIKILMQIWEEIRINIITQKTKNHHLMEI